MYNRKGNFSQVAWNKIWEESIKRENKTIILPDPTKIFTNPQTVKVVTQKINQRPRYFLDKDAHYIEYMKKKKILTNDEIDSTSEMVEMKKEQEEDKVKMKSFLKMTKKINESPNVKYKESMTTQQELGWYLDKFDERDVRFYHPRKNCDETKYANIFMRQVHLQNRYGGGNKQPETGGIKRAAFK